MQRVLLISIYHRDTAMKSVEEQSKFDHCSWRRRRRWKQLQTYLIEKHGKITSYVFLTIEGQITNKVLASYVFKSCLSENRCAVTFIRRVSYFFSVQFNHVLPELTEIRKFQNVFGNMNPFYSQNRNYICCMKDMHPNYRSYSHMI